MAIPIALSLNSAFTKQSTVVMFSALQNAHRSTQYYFYLLTYDLTDNDKAYISGKISGFEAFAGLEVIYLSQQNYADIPVLVNKISKENMFRVFLPQLLPHIPKLIYLDSDILVLKDLTELYNTSIEGKAYAACSEKKTFELIKNPFSNYNVKRIFDLYYKEGFDLFNEQNHYINSGILVINNDYWAAHNYTKRALKFLTRLNGNGLVYSDQDALNYLALQDGPASRIYISWSYNFHSQYLDMTRITDPRIRFLYKALNLEAEMTANYQPHIVHYVGKNKPWKGSTSFFSPLYREYAAKIGWHIDPPGSFKIKLKQFTFRKFIKNMTPYGLIVMKNQNKN
ncbi:MAG: glycosyltransferase family 8 protein [Spirochaetaceae bacterium]|nr:glycosyltransferase family 8 protein [Spirochaetaceae bacterium]